MSIQNVSSVAHYFFNNVESECHTSNNSFHYDNNGYNKNTLFSYSTPIAKLYENNRNKKLLLITNGSYSVTTSRHLSEIRNANNYRSIEVSEILIDTKKNHTINLNQIKEDIKENIIKLANCRKAQYRYTDMIDRLLNNYNNYLDFFNIKRKTISLTDFDIDKIMFNDKHKKAIALKKQKAQKRKLLKAQIENIAKWKNNEINSFPNAYQLPVMLRVNNDIIETSHQASIPVEHSERLWKLINHCHTKKTEYRPKSDHSFRVGHYTLDYIDTQGSLKIGCHYIPYPELKRIADLLNY